MTTYFEAAGLRAPWVLDVPGNETLHDDTAADTDLESIDQAAAAAQALASLDDIKSTVRRDLLVEPGIGQTIAPIGEIRSGISIGHEALAQAGTAVDNPAHAAARLALLGAVAEATRPDGNPWRALPYVVRGLGQMATADTEPLAMAPRRPVSTRQFVLAGLVAASRAVPGSRASDWRQATATRITNYR